MSDLNKIEKKKLYEVCGIANLVLITKKKIFVSVVEVINIRRYAHKTNKLRNVYTIGMEGYRAHNSNTHYALYLIPFTCYGCLLCFTTKCLSVVCSLHSTK